MPILTSSELTLRKESRMIYANHIIQTQKVEQKCATRITIGGDEGTLASDITMLHEGAVFTTPAEQTAILAANNCSTGNQLVYAIPDFNNTENTLLTGSAEPGTWQAVASGLPNSLMNGTYTTTGSHFYYGNASLYGTDRSFKRIKATDASGGWLSRTASNNYNNGGSPYYGSYAGNTRSIINGQVVLGEYLTITAPYYFILNSYTIVSGHMGSTPSAWTIAGSKDGGVTYYTIDVQTNITIVGNTITVELPSNTRAYNNYKLIVTRGNLTGTGGGANIDSWNLFTYM